MCIRDRSGAGDAHSESRQQFVLWIAWSDFIDRARDCDARLERSEEHRGGGQHGAVVPRGEAVRRIHREGLVLSLIHISEPTRPY